MGDPGSPEEGASGGDAVAGEAPPEAARAEALAEVARWKEAAAAADATATAALEECERLKQILQAIQDAAQCPILHQCWRAPAVASDGYTYERRQIEEWQRRAGCTSPLTRELLEPKVYQNRFALQVLRCLEAAGLGSQLPQGGGQEPAAGPMQRPSAGGPMPMASAADDEAFAKAFRKAIDFKDEDAAVRVLQQRPGSFPGLNARLSYDGPTLLHHVIRNGLSEVAEAIARRPDFTLVNRRDQFGQTALHLAAFRHQAEVCEAIVSRRDFTELRSVDKDGWTALELARGNKCWNAVLVLERAESQVA